jgi:hypothetical protein
MYGAGPKVYEGWLVYLAFLARCREQASPASGGVIACFGWPSMIRCLGAVLIFFYKTRATRHFFIERRLLFFQMRKSACVRWICYAPRVKPSINMKRARWMMLQMFSSHNDGMNRSGNARSKAE